MGASSKIRTGPGFGLEKPKIIEPGILEASLSCAMAILSGIVAQIEVENFFGLIGTAKSRKEFFGQVIILEQSGEKKNSKLF